jgi:hypothetical protein
MFVEIKTLDGKEILLNVNQIVSIDKTSPVAGLRLAGSYMIHVHLTGGRRIMLDSADYGMDFWRETLNPPPIWVTNPSGAFGTDQLTNGS